MTNASIGAGADWHCGRCGQRWDAGRLATVAAYEVWVSGRVKKDGELAIEEGGR